MSVYVLLWELLIMSYLRVVYSNKGVVCRGRRNAVIKVSCFECNMDLRSQKTMQMMLVGAFLSNEG